MEQTQPTTPEMNLLLGLYNTGHYAETEARASSLVETYPDAGPAWKLLGLSQLKLGRNALQALRRAAELMPGLAEVHFDLGLAQKRLGLLGDAAESNRRALKIKPDFVAAYHNLGEILKALGQLYEAMNIFRHALKISPDFADAHNSLGATLRELGQLDAALASCRRAILLKPDFADAHNNLGNILKELGQIKAAINSYHDALNINPDFSEAHSNLGAALKDLGQLGIALASCRRALELKPDLAEAHNNLGIVLKELGQYDDAVTALRRAVDLKPDYFEAYTNLGNALRDLGQLDEAKNCFQRALQLKYVLAEAQNKQGAAFLDRQQLHGAAACFHRALVLNPDYARAHRNLGNALKEFGQMDASLASLRRAAELQPDSLEHAISMHLLLPIIPESRSDISRWRERFQNGVAALMECPGILDDPGNKLDGVSFYLAYHDANDRALMESLGHLFRARVPSLTTIAPHVPGWRTPAERGRRIRVGFLSEYLYEHTIGKHYQGFIRHLDRKRFEVVVIHGHKSKRDVFRQKLDALADEAITLPSSLKSQQQAVAAAHLDVLFYPDIGMTPSTYFLAYARLAPVQATSWGHPDTTGLDSIDYYVSAMTNEPEEAESHYTERLVRLNRLPCFYLHTQASSISKLSKAALGLPETGTLYGCPQSLFKIHPDFDAVLADIAKGDPNGHLILPEGKYSTWTELLKARWAKTFPILLERVIFLPRMSWDDFMGVMEHMDVLLDPPHFGSGNTLYDAMVNGTPVVTWPGRFARGRNVAAAYRQMGVADAPIAPRLEDYAPLALSLARDTKRRLALRKASVEAARRELFEDMQAVREFEEFLEAAVAAAGQGEKLKQYWRPDIDFL